MIWTTYMHAFNLYTPSRQTVTIIILNKIYIKHTSIHIHAYNLHVSIEIVNTNIEALWKHIVYHESCITSTLIIKKSQIEIYIHQYIPTNNMCIHFSRPKRLQQTFSRNSSILEFCVFVDVELFLSLSLSLSCVWNICFCDHTLISLIT